MQRQSRSPRGNPVLFALLAVFLVSAPVSSTVAQTNSNDQGWTFASMPDFLNTDVADVRSAPGWTPAESNRWFGEGNATHEEFEKSIDYMLDRVARENPEFVLAAGDIVNGEWNRYSQGTGREVFGPTDTYRQQKVAMRRAADTFYSRWKERFTTRGMTPYPAVGDHEVGDNSWPAGSAKSRLVHYWRELFSNYFTRDTDGRFTFDIRPEGTPQEKTAYAFQHRNVLVVTVDLHHQPDPEEKASKYGSVVAELGEGQLNWFRKTLRKANNEDAIDFIIVQGHYPVITNVRYSKASSHITVEGGTDSDFWKAMEQYNVDFYFAGEIHETTTSMQGGVIQVVHGGWIAAVPRFTYLRGEVRGKQMNVRLKRMRFNYLGRDGEPLMIWQNEWPHRIPVLDKEYGVQTVGELTIDRTSGRTKIRNQTGEMTFYDGSKKVIPPDRELVPVDSEQ